MSSERYPHDPFQPEQATVPQPCDSSFRHPVIPMRDARAQHACSEYALHAYAQQFGHSWLGEHLDSLTIQTLASRAYHAANRLLLGTARRVRRLGQTSAGHRRRQDQYERYPLVRGPGGVERAGPAGAPGST